MNLLEKRYDDGDDEEVEEDYLLEDLRVGEGGSSQRTLLHLVLEKRDDDGDDEEVEKDYLNGDLHV